MGNPNGFSDRQLATIALGMLEPGPGWLDDSGIKRRPGPEPKDDRARMAAVFDSGFMPSTIDRSALSDVSQVRKELETIARS